MIENIRFSNEKVFIQVNDMLSYRINKISNDVQSIIYNTEIISLLNANYQNSNDGEIINNANQINAYLQAIGASEDILSVTLSFSNDNPMSEYFPDFNHEHKPSMNWNEYRDGLSEETRWILLSDFSGNKSISILLYVYSSNDYQVITAVIWLTINPYNFTNILRNSINTEGTVFYIFNHRKQIILSSEDMENWLNEESLIGLLSDDSPEFFSKMISLDGRHFFASYKKINSLKGWSPNWTLVSITPFDRIQQPIDNMFRNILLIIIISASVFFVFSFLFSSSISQRISSLTYGMREVQKGKFKGMIIPRGSDEITELMSDFNYMIKRIEILMSENMKYISDSRRNELFALQSQINPHFLYNTLDLINWIAMKHDVPEISEIVYSLSRFYKLSLNQGREIVTLSDEVNHITAYLEIQNKRFENSIYLSIDIPGELLGCSITKLTLQPLVENALVHSILWKRSKKITLKISAKKDNANMIVTVWDNGDGIPAEKLSGLVENGFKSQTGYGLANINERIKLYFGVQYGIEVESRYGEYTAVLITLPIRRS
jgi:two-component system sensor histidine kinase YesM